MEVTRRYRARFEAAVINQAYDKFRSKYKSWALKARFFEIERGNDRVRLSSFDEFIAEVAKADGYRYGYFDAEWYLTVDYVKSGGTYVSVALKNKKDIDSILEIFNANEIPETPSGSKKDEVKPADKDAEIPTLRSDLSKWKHYDGTRFSGSVIAERRMSDSSLV